MMVRSTTFACVFTILLHHPFRVHTARKKQCLAVINDIFTNCHNHTLADHSGNNEVCMEETMCRKTFTISRVRKQVFFYTIANLIKRMLHHCCGPCSNTSIIRNFTYISEVNHSSIKFADFVYPILGRHDAQELHGHYFLPAFDLPSSFYFTLPKSKEYILMEVLSGFTKLWPLLVIGLLAALISGFVTWILECRENEEQFPPPFHVGIFEGFWWSVISMTTVGYGDKSPKSIFGRLFAIIWILIGVAICSIFTASLTTEIINAGSTSVKNMEGRVIGCMNYRTNDAVMIAQHGGILHAIDFTNTIEGVGDLIELVERKEIDGFLLNRQSYYYFLDQIKKKPKYRQQRAIEERVPLVHNEVFNHLDRLTYGMLIKTREHYEYFRKFVDNNWLHIQTCHRVKNNHKDKSVDNYETDIFSPKAGLFYPFLHYSLGLLGIIFCLGLSYELKRRHSPSCKQRVGCPDGNPAIQ